MGTTCRRLKCSLPAHFIASNFGGMLIRGLPCICFCVLCVCTAHACSGVVCKCICYVFPPAPKFLMQKWKYVTNCKISVATPHWVRPVASMCQSYAMLAYFNHPTATIEKGDPLGGGGGGAVVIILRKHYKLLWLLNIGLCCNIVLFFVWIAESTWPHEFSSIRDFWFSRGLSAGRIF